MASKNKNIYSLDDMKASIEEKNPSCHLELDGEKVTLKNLFRLRKDDRKAVVKALRSLETLTADAGEEGQVDLTLEQFDELSDAVETVIRGIAGRHGDKVVEYIDGDIMMGQEIIQGWVGVTQPGEEKNSSDS